MAHEIRTSPPHKEIKVLDRAESVASYIKEATVKSGDAINDVQMQEDVSIQEYASNKVAHAAEGAASGTLYHAGKMIKRTAKTIKKRRDNSGVGNFVEDAEQIKEQTTTNSERIRYPKTEKVRARTPDNKEYLKIKTKKHIEIKNGKASIKTMEQSGHAVVKTSGTMAKKAELAKKLSSIATERARQAAKYTDKTIETMIKKAMVIISSCIKAISAARSSLIAALGAGGGVAALILSVVVLFWGVLCLVGGGNANVALPVSAEVEAYEPLIRQYATQYGISEYVELIKAVMMQESGGRGLDPMQSSEGGFNIRYPRHPNGITDPEYSIECGVRDIKNCLEQAEVENPIDMENIKLSVQGYNFGNGYISWAKNKYGGYSLGNAEEFSKMMAKRRGWDSYGDTKYVPHVFRYYVFGRTPLGIGNQMIVTVAERQLGNVGGEPYWSWYGFDSRVEWCACFVSWCADQCGYIDSGLVPKFSKCSEGAKWFQNHGRFLDGSSVPVAGSIIFFDWGDDGSVNHVGIVKKVEKGTIYTIEGNSGNRCRERSYVIGDNRIYGYGLIV